jgi:hypothetical protein
MNVLSPDGGGGSLNAGSGHFANLSQAAPFSAR